MCVCVCERETERDRETEREREREREGTWRSHRCLQSDHVRAKAVRLLAPHASVVNVQPFVALDEVIAPDDGVPPAPNLLREAE